MLSKKIFSISQNSCLFELLITTFRKVWKLGSLGFTSLCTCTCRIYLLIHDLSPLWTLSKRRSGPGWFFGKIEWPTNLVGAIFNSSNKSVTFCDIRMRMRCDVAHHVTTSDDERRDLDWLIHPIKQVGWRYRTLGHSGWPTEWLTAWLTDWLTPQNKFFSSQSFDLSSSSSR